MPFPSRNYHPANSGVISCQVLFKTPLDEHRGTIACHETDLTASPEVFPLFREQNHQPILRELHMQTYRKKGRDMFQGGMVGWITGIFGGFDGEEG
jgi:hypothetical protein